MRSIFGIVFIIIAASGCLEGSLSPGEAQLCLSSTAVQPSVIPACKSTQDCDEKLGEFFPAQTYQNSFIGTESIHARKGIAGTWSKVRLAAEMLERVHQSCTTMQAANILSLAVASASELQNALAASEEAQEYTYRALEKTIRSGAEMQLENVKDTRAFEQYAGLLQKAHDIEMQNPSSEWGRTQLQNQAYFENISKIIGKNKAGKYGVEWNSIFGVYKTGVGIAAPERARIITAVSPLWQGALSAFLGKSKSTNALEIVSEIRANEVIENVEIVVAPQSGIIIQIWKEIAAFDREISTLKKEEETLEKTIEQKISTMQASEESSSNEIDEWIKLAPTINEWANIRGENEDGELNYPSIKERLAELAGQHATQRNRRVTQAIPIGKRIEEWRKLEKSTEDILVQINEKNQLIERWKEVCETIGEKSIAKPESIESADDCQKRLDEQNSDETITTGAAKLAAASVLKNCVSELNEYQEALEEEITTAEQFEYYFESGSLNACESAKMNAQNRYAAIPIVKEWLEKIVRLKEVASAVGFATHTLEWEEKDSASQKWKNVQKIITQESETKYSQKEMGKKLNELDELVLELENELDKIIQEAALKIKWKVVQPAIMRVNEIETLEWEGTIFPHWGNEIAQHFVASTNNPGIQTSVRANESIQATVNEKKIILDGSTLPKEGIIVSGIGRSVGIQLIWEKISAQAIGTTARVIREGRLVAESIPADGQWKWTPPEGMLKESMEIQINEKPAQKEWKGNLVEVNISVSEKNMRVKQEYTATNAIITSTQIVEQTNQWGRTYTTYRAVVENRLVDENVLTDVYTGITADAMIVEGVYVTNEGGEQVAYRHNADGSLVIPHQEVGARRTREYRVIVEMLNGAEEWASLVERLLSEAASIAASDDLTIKNEAEKIKTRLWQLKSEKNTQTIAQKLIAIQFEISQLHARSEEEENKWAVLESQWAQTREQAAQSESEWVTKGNVALQNRDSTKLTEAIQKIVEKNAATKTPPVQNEAVENEKINEMKEKIAATEAMFQKYEKGISVGCEKLIQVNFSCPLTEEMVRGFKKIVAADKKTVEKWEEKLAKLDEEQKRDEWKNNTAEWEKIEAEISDIAKTVEESLRVLRNAGVERVNALKKETTGNTIEEIVAAVEKAATATENEEYGKGVFIAQNMLNYLNGNKMTGMAAVPALAWPFLGIIALAGGWLGWKEWKKKKIVEIPLQKIPKGNTNSKERPENSFAREPLPMRAEHQGGGKEITGQYIQSRPRALGRIEEENPRREKNQDRLPRKEEPRSREGE
jgi:hypothetical protein